MKKKYIAGLIFAGLSLLAGITIIPALYKKTWKAQHEAVWGTVQNPTYKITCDMQPSITYSRYISKQEEYHKKQIEIIQKIKTDTVKKKIAEFKEYFQKNPLTPEQKNQLKDCYETFQLYLEPAGLEEYVEKLREFMDLYDNAFDSFQSNANMLLLELSQRDLTGSLDQIINELYLDIGMKFDKSSRLSSQYGEADAFARNVFESMTGKKLPENVKLDICEIEEEDVAGLADYINAAIKSEDGHYARVLSVMLHELGHLSSQHDEAAYTSINPLRCWSRDVRLLDEACAYCFEIAGAYALSKKDSHLANVAQLYLINYVKIFINEYFDGEQEYHREAAAIADAAITVFGDPAKAYNYLATADSSNLDPRIKETIEKNRSKYQWVKEHEVSKMCDEKSSELDDLNKEFLKMIEVVHPKGKELAEERREMEREARRMAEQECEKYKK